MRFYGRKNYPVNLVDDAVIGCASAPLRPDRHSRRRAEKPHGKLESRLPVVTPRKAETRMQAQVLLKAARDPQPGHAWVFSFVLPET